VKSTNNEVPHYAVFYNLIILHHLTSKYCLHHLVIKHSDVFYSLSERYQVSYPHKRQVKLIFTFLDGTWEDERV